MPDSTVDNRRVKTQCISSQEKLVEKLVGSIIDSKLLRQEITNLAAEVARNDKKHTDSIDQLRTFFTTQNKQVIDSIGAVQASLTVLSSTVEPYLKKADGTKKWVIRTALVSAPIMFLMLVWGDKAEKWLEFFIKVSG